MTGDTARFPSPGNLPPANPTRQAIPPEPSPGSPRLAAFSTSSYSAAGMPARLLIATGGEWAKLSRPQVGVPEPREWKRGAISEFSARSRSRMLQSLAKTDRRAVDDDGLFVTLTYPREWPPTAAACKRHLEAFRKRVNRRWPRAWFYWKLEYQKRGAEHFHLLMFNVPTVNPEWFQEAWHDIVKLGNHWHVKYGADVKRMYSWKQAGSYCAKYCAKVEEHPMTPTPGRFWGIGTRTNRVETIVEAGISDVEFFRIRRAFKRHMHLRGGYHQPGGARSGVWTRISNGGAKRLLGNAAAEDPPPRLLDESTGELKLCDRDRPPACNDWSNTSAPAARPRISTDRTGHTPTLSGRDWRALLLPQPSNAA